MMSTNNKIIGVIMTYNCAPLVEGIYRQLPPGLFDQVVITDDGSTDNIVEVANKLGITLFRREHLGYGGNIKHGLQEALKLGGEYMVEIHGDGQYGAAAMVPGIEKIKQGYDFVLGSRFTNWRQPLRDGMSLARYLANIGLSWTERLILRVPLTEFHPGFRIYSRKLIETVGFEHTADDYLFSFEIIVKAVFHRLKIGEVPVRCFYSQEHSSISLKKAAVYSFQTFWVLFKYILARLGFKVRLFRQ